MICTVTCNPAIDYVVALPGELQPGTINRATREAIQFGGKGINVSHMLRNLGVRSVVLGFVAGFTGDALEKGLAELGLQTRFLRTDGMTRINVKVKAASETEINGMGPRVTDTDLIRLGDQLDELRESDILVLSGSVPGGLGADTYEKLLSLLEGRGVRAVVDAAGALLTNTLKHRPFLIKPNLPELASIFGKEPENDEEILSFARILREKGAQNVLVSLAGDGALLLTAEGIPHRLRCPRGQVVNSVGAGDAMVAGFLKGWLDTGDYGFALKLAVAAGSATAFSPGLADKEQVEQQMHRIF